MSSTWTDLLGTDLTVRHVELDGCDTRVLEAGLGGLPLPLLPGTGDHLESYTRNLRTLAADRRVVAYDYPGHGYSALATADLEIEHYVRHLDALVDHLGCDQVDLSGESLGAGSPSSTPPRTSAGSARWCSTRPATPWPGPR